MGKQRGDELDLSRYGLWLLVAAGVLLAFVALTSIARRAATVRELEHQVATVSAQYQHVSATQAYLQTQIARATEGVGFDEQLREEAGMARQGDEVIVPLPVGTAAPTPTPPAANATAEALPPPPWEMWWRLFFAPLN